MTQFTLYGTKPEKSRVFVKGKGGYEQRCIALSAFLYSNAHMLPAVLLHIL